MSASADYKSARVIKELSIRLPGRFLIFQSRTKTSLFPSRFLDTLSRPLPHATRILEKLPADSSDSSCTTSIYIAFSAIFFAFPRKLYKTKAARTRRQTRFSFKVFSQTANKLFVDRRFPFLPAFRTLRIFVHRQRVPLCPVWSAFFYFILSRTVLIVDEPSVKNTVQRIAQK